ncbi:unnamed protein product [Amoebophrya sp. A120]|nr:unnamed protein product [Amoebophrya sp. A120]|eukprot:GSA120T00025212001.1
MEFEQSTWHPIRHPIRDVALILPKVKPNVYKEHPKFSEGKRMNYYLTVGLSVFLVTQFFFIFRQQYLLELLVIEFSACAAYLYYLENYTKDDEDVCPLGCTTFFAVLFGAVFGAVACHDHFLHYVSFYKGNTLTRVLANDPAFTLQNREANHIEFLHAQVDTRRPTAWQDGQGATYCLAPILEPADLLSVGKSEKEEENKNKKTPVQYYAIGKDCCSMVPKAPAITDADKGTTIGVADEKALPKFLARQAAARENATAFAKAQNLTDSFTCGDAGRARKSGPAGLLDIFLHGNSSGHGMVDPTLQGLHSDLPLTKLLSLKGLLSFDPLTQLLSFDTFLPSNYAEKRKYDQARRMAEQRYNLTTVMEDLERNAYPSMEPEVIYVHWTLDPVLYAQGKLRDSLYFFCLSTLCFFLPVMYLLSYQLAKLATQDAFEERQEEIEAGRERGGGGSTAEEAEDSNYVLDSDSWANESLNEEAASLLDDNSI